MKESIHQSYRNLLEEMHADSINCGAATLREPFSESIYFPPGYFNGRGEFDFQSLLIALLSIALVVFGYLYFFERPAAVPVFKPEVSLALPEPLINKKTEALESELELMKKILVGLVQSVESLSKEPRQTLIAENTSNQERFPYPVKVTAEKAHLRNEPTREGKSLGAVPKDTVLLAMEEKDGWMKVSTPKGEDAWISRDIIIEKDN